MTINGNWGYNAEDHNWKSADTLLRNLIDIAIKGGNYLLNVGPDATGVIPQPEVQRLKQMGTWLKINGQAISGPTSIPFKELLPWGRCTQKKSKEDTVLYLTVFNWPKDGELFVPKLKNSIDAYLLTVSGEHKPLKSVSGDDGVSISVSSIAPDSIASVIVLKIKGALQVE